MERTIDRSPVGTCSHPKGKSIFRPASLDDDAPIRQMLRNNPVGSWVRLTYEREPSFFAASAIEGETHKTYMAEAPDDNSVNAVFSWSTRKRYVEGSPRSIGYLGQLRIQERYGGKIRFPKAGFEICRQALQNSRLEPYFLTSIIADNDRAIRILTSGLKGIPTYKHIGSMGVLAVRCKKPVLSKKNDVLTEEQPSLEDIIDFVARASSDYDFAPVWTTEDILSDERCPGLHQSDFVVIEEAGRIVGCAAIWDQSANKQYVVSGYRSPICYLRSLMNAAGWAASMVGGWPRLPKVGEALNSPYLSHFFVEDQREDVAVSLVSKALKIAGSKGYDSLVVGLDTNAPIYKALANRFRAFKYQSNIYAAHWSFGDQAVDKLGGRLIAPEIAVL